MSSLNIDISGIHSTVSNTITSQTSMQEAIGVISNTMSTMAQTILSQTNEEFNMWFEREGIKQTVDALNTLATANNSTLKTYDEYIRFKAGTIELGKIDSEVKLLLENDRISFKTGDNTSAYITNNMLYITDSTILVRQQIGKWVTEEDEFGNLNTSWVGD